MEKDKLLKQLKNSLKMYTETLAETIEKGNDATIKLVTDEIVKIQTEINKLISSNKTNEKLLTNHFLVRFPETEDKILPGSIIGFYEQGQNQITFNIEDNTLLPVFTLEKWLTYEFADDDSIFVDYTDENGMVLYSKKFTGLSCLRYQQLTPDTRNNGQVRIYSVLFNFKTAEILKR